MLYLCFVLGSAQLLSGWAPNQTYHDNAAWWLSWIDGLVIAVSATSLQLSLLFKPTIILLKQWSCGIENDAVMFEWEQRSIQNITIHLFGCFPLPTVGQGVFSMTHYYTEDAPPLTGTGGLTDSYPLAGGPRYQCWMVWEWYFDGTIWSTVWRMQYLKKG